MQEEICSFFRSSYDRMVKTWNQWFCGGMLTKECQNGELESGENICLLNVTINYLLLLQKAGHIHLTSNHPYRDVSASNTWFAHWTKSLQRSSICRHTCFRTFYRTLIQWSLVRLFIHVSAFRKSLEIEKKIVLLRIRSFWV